MRFKCICLVLTAIVFSATIPVSGWVSLTFAAETTSPLFQKYKGKQQELKLPAKITDVLLAGGGRYLLIHMKSTRQLAVYDVNQTKIIKTLTMISGDVQIAAGAEKFVVIDQNQKIIERWSLVSFERETARQIPYAGVLKCMGMGYASKGPLLVHYAVSADRNANGYCMLVDLETLTEVPDLTFSQRYGFPRHSERVRVRASAGGELFGISAFRGDRDSHLWSLDGKKVNHFRSGNLNFVRPLPDGSYVLTRNGLYTTELYPKGYDHVRVEEKNYVATLHPAFYIEVPYLKRDKSDKKSNSNYFCILHLCETGQRIANLPVSPLNLNKDRSGYTDLYFEPDLSLDKRFIYIPQADQLLTVPYTNDRLLVTPIQLQTELRKRGTDYLFISSVPPKRCQKGEKFEYQLQVESSASQVQVELSAAPEGMKLTNKNTLLWDVPETFAEDDLFVVITVTSKGDQKTFQTFRLEVQER